MGDSIKITDFDHICRFCLEKDVTFRQLFKTKAKYQYRNSVLSCIKITIDSEIDSSDGLPKQICEVCHTSLSRFGLFKRRCIKSVDTLKTILRKYEESEKVMERNDQPLSPNIEFGSDYNSLGNAGSTKGMKLDLSDVGDSTVNVSPNYTLDDWEEIGIEVVKVEPAAEIIYSTRKRRRREVAKKSKPIIDDENDIDEEDVEISKLKRRKRGRAIEKVDNDRKCDLPTTNEIASDIPVKLTISKRRNRCKKRKEPPIPPKNQTARIQTDLELFPINGTKENKPSGKVGREKKACPLCGELYQNVNLHLVTHATERNFPCDECGKAFKTKGTLKTHQMAIHMEIRPFKCSVCKALFKSKESLRVHRIVHTGEREFECKICGRLLSRISSYRFHMLTHTQERKHECPHCHEKFITHQRLHHHLPKHTGEKIFQCGICTERFRYSSAATQHRRRHMNHNNAYVCTFCQKEFKDMRIFMIHHQSIHNVKLPLSENVEPEGGREDNADNKNI